MLMPIWEKVKRRVNIFRSLKKKILIYYRICCVAIRILNRVTPAVCNSRHPLNQIETSSNLPFPNGLWPLGLRFLDSPFDGLCLRLWLSGPLPEIRISEGQKSQKAVRVGLYFLPVGDRGLFPPD